MSFEANQARLIQELVDAQAQVRAQYGLKPRTEAQDVERRSNAAPQGRRATLAAI